MAFECQKAWWFLYLVKKVKQIPQGVVLLIGKLTSSVNQSMREQEVRLTLYEGTISLKLLLYDKKICIRWKMCTGLIGC